ncbi:helix-turn-helix transcriptional regulator [Megasphaera paucivorans]|uniref:Helix-turn-helix n=1 Tax=Megasphaera paucivorans TaxID=349095 RepID=A0A1G9UPI2_9FIRM|nr:helix-turn-helix transcriptional regulator [Megasphaera paucivorans]SDM61773.1 Helix-turn-helix [Megasphaera paucivorans]
MTEKFGDKLKKIRLSKNMSQEELAVFLHTSKQVISRYETNQRTPKITVAQEYADKLKIPLLYLIDDKILSVEKLQYVLNDIKHYSTEGYTASEKDMIKKYRCLPSEGKATVDAVIDIQYNAATQKISNDTAD